MVYILDIVPRLSSACSNCYAVAFQDFSHDDLLPRAIHIRPGVLFLRPTQKKNKTVYSIYASFLAL